MTWVPRASLFSEWGGLLWSTKWNSWIWSGQDPYSKCTAVASLSSTGINSTLKSLQHMTCTYHFTIWAKVISPTNCKHLQPPLLQRCLHDGSWGLCKDSLTECTVAHKSLLYEKIVSLKVAQNYMMDIIIRWSFIEIIRFKAPWNLSKLFV